MTIRMALALMALASGAPLAAAPVAVSNDVYVERENASARVLEPATTLRRGDRVIYVVSWRAARPDRFTITNPLPATVAYQGSADGAEQVSVDGGRTWGELGALRVRDRGAWRDATPEDVTHVRWQVPRQLALAGSGRLTWSGIVR